MRNVWIGLAALLAIFGAVVAGNVVSTLIVTPSVSVVESVTIDTAITSTSAARASETLDCYSNGGSVLVHFVSGTRWCDVAPKLGPRQGVSDLGPEDYPLSW